MTEKNAKNRINRNRKYNETNYDRITLYVKKGQADQIKAHVKKNHPGKSVNEFIKMKIKEELPQIE